MVVVVVSRTASCVWSHASQCRNLKKLVEKDSNGCNPCKTKSDLIKHVSRLPSSMSAAPSSLWWATLNPVFHLNQLSAVRPSPKCHLGLNRTQIHSQNPHNLTGQACQPSQPLTRHSKRRKKTFRHFLTFLVVSSTVPQLLA